MVPPIIHRRSEHHNTQREDASEGKAASHKTGSSSGVRERADSSTHRVIHDTSSSNVVTEPESSRKPQEEPGLAAPEGPGPPRSGGPGPWRKLV